MATKKTLVEIEHDFAYAITYDKQLWMVDKSLIYNAISALALALEYMHVDTAVPRFAQAMKQDVAKMELVLIELRKLGVPVDTSKPQA